MLKEFGPVNLNGTSSDSPNLSAKGSPKQSGSASPRSSGVASPRSRASANTNPNTGRLMKENNELAEKVASMKRRIAALAEEITSFQDLEAEMKAREQDERRRAQKQFQRKKEDLIAEYEVKQDNLRQEIEALHQKLEQKTADEGGRSGLKSLFGEDYVSVDVSELEKGNGADFSSSPGVDEEDEDEDGGRVKSALLDEDDESA